MMFVVRRGRSHLVAPMAPISVDLRLEKDDWRRGKVQIRREGKIKACGTTARDRPRFQCLHIGLSTTTTVPRLRNEARQSCVRPASIGAFSQCHQGSFASGRFTVNLGAWFAPTMTRSSIHALVAGTARANTNSWLRRRSDLRSSAGRLPQVDSVLPTSQPNAAAGRLCSQRLAQTVIIGLRQEAILHAGVGSIRMRNAGDDLGRCIIGSRPPLPRSPGSDR